MKSIKFKTVTSMVNWLENNRDKKLYTADRKYFDDGRENSYLVWENSRPFPEYRYWIKCERGEPLEYAAWLETDLYYDPEWYEDIPEIGVLCWVRNDTTPLSLWEAALIHECVEWPESKRSFRTVTGMLWKEAIPMDGEEVLEMIAENYP